MITIENCRRSLDSSSAFFSLYLGFVAGFDLHKLPSVEKINEILKIEDEILKAHKDYAVHEFSPPLPINPLGHETYVQLVVASLLNKGDASNIYWHHHRITKNKDYEEIELFFCVGEDSPWSLWKLNEPSRRRKITVSLNDEGIDPHSIFETPLIQTFSEMQHKLNGNGSSGKLAPLYNRFAGEFLLANLNNKTAVTEEGSMVLLK